MEQKLPPSTTEILNLYLQGHSPARIGYIVRLEEGRVLFTLYQFGALSPEVREVWAERLRHAREAPTQATEAGFAATPYTEPAGIAGRSRR